MTDKEIIAAAGIKSALIVDDGYDLVPRASELADVDWDIFRRRHWRRARALGSRFPGL